jgi:hypothetical protein
MTRPTHHSTESRCPDCGNGDAIVRVRGNAISGVCTVCRRADIGPLLDADDLALVAGEDIEGHLFMLEAARTGQAEALRVMTLSRQVIEDNTDDELRAMLDDRVVAALSVELRMPVPPR